MDHLLFFRLRCRLVFDSQFSHEPQDLFVRGHIAADAAEELDRAGSVEREAHIFDHLAVAHFDNDEDARVLRDALEMQFGKWVEGDGAKHADIDSGGARFGCYGF